MLPDNLKEFSDGILSRLTDEVILDVCFEVHRLAKTNVLFMNEPGNNENCYNVVQEMNYDVFGQKIVNKLNVLCECPNCGIQKGCSLMSRHLVDCMNGKSTQRNQHAKKMVNSVEMDVHSGCSSIEEDDNDKDTNWGSSAKRKSKKQRKPAKGRANKSRLRSNSKGNKKLANYSPEVVVVSDFSAINKEAEEYVGRNQKMMYSGLKQSKAICTNFASHPSEHLIDFHANDDLGMACLKSLDEDQLPIDVLEGASYDFPGSPNDAFPLGMRKKGKKVTFSMAEKATKKKL